MRDGSAPGLSVSSAQALETISSRSRNRVQAGCDENAVRALGLRPWLLAEGAVTGQATATGPLRHGVSRCPDGAGRRSTYRRCRELSPRPAAQLATASVAPR